MLLSPPVFTYRIVFYLSFIFFFFFFLSALLTIVFPPQYNSIYSGPEQPPVQPHPSPPNTIKIPITGIALAEYPKSIHSDHSDGSGGLQYETYSIIDRSRSNSPVLMPDENASLRSPLGTLRHAEDVDMIPTSLSSSVDAHVYDNVYAKNGSQRTGLMRKPVSPRGAMGD